MAIFRTAIFWNHDHISDQTKPNQTSPIGILHFARHSLRAYHKKFQVSRSNGSRDNGSGKFKIWKLSILGFFEKGPPEPPQKVKKWFQYGVPKKFSSIFGMGCHKVCTCWLNGANCEMWKIQLGELHNCWHSLCFLWLLKLNVSNYLFIMCHWQNETLWLHINVQ